MNAIPQRSSEYVKQLRLQAGRWLRARREQKGLTQRDLANHVGLKYYTFISQIEAGQGRIPPDQYHAWADALSVPPRDFAKTMMQYYDPHTYELLFSSNEESGRPSEDKPR